MVLSNSKRNVCSFSLFVQDKIQRIIKKMIDFEIIVSGNFNKSSYDRTKWYSFKNEGMFINSNCHSADLRNGFCKTAEPIPHTKTDKKVVVDDEKKSFETFFENDLTEKEQEEFNEFLHNSIYSLIPESIKKEAIQDYGWSIVVYCINYIFEINPSLKEGKKPKGIESLTAKYLDQNAKKKNGKGKQMEENKVSASQDYEALILGAILNDKFAQHQAIQRMLDIRRIFSLYNIKRFLMFIRKLIMKVKELN